MGVDGIQVFEGDGIDYGPIRITSDPTWRNMRVMYSTRKEGRIVVPEEKFIDWPIQVSLTTKVQKKNITTLLIARDVEIKFHGDRQHDAMRYCTDRYRKDRKLFNMFLEQIDENEIVKLLYCKGCKITDLLYYDTVCEYQDQFMQVQLSAMSVMPIRDIESVFNSKTP